MTNLRRGGIDDGSVAVPKAAKVLVAGGGGNYHDAEVFDPATNQWGLTGSTVYRWGGSPHLALLPNGQVMVIGGQSLPGTLGSFELYDPRQSCGKWQDEA